MLAQRGLGLPPSQRSRQLGPSSCQQPVRHTASSSRRHRVLCSVSKQLVQLEKAVLADMPTEQVIHLLKKHGVDIQTVNDNPDGPTQQLEQQQKLQHNQQEQQEQQPQQPKAQQQEQATQSQLQLEQRALQAQKQQQQHVQLQSQHQEQQPQQQQELRRHMSSRSSHVAAAAAKRSQLLSKLAAARVAARAKIVRLPLRLTIAGRAGSRRYLTVPVDVEGVGFVDFLLDSSTFYSRITPAFRNKLGLGPADGVPVITGQKGPAQKTAAATVAEDSSTQGIAANSKSSDGNSNSSISSSNGTSSSSNSSSKNTSSNSSSGKLRMRQRVQLPDLWLGTAQLPKQQAYVAPLLLLPSRRQASNTKSPLTVSSSSVSATAGSLGVQVLRSFELDVDVAGNQLAVHPAGHVALGLCNVAGMAAVPCRYTKSGAIVLPVSLAGSAPFTGLLDLSAATSIMNWEAAALLGMTCAEQQQEQWEQQQHAGSDQDMNASCNNSSSHNHNSTSAGGDATTNMYGYFGTIEVVPDEMMLKPILPDSKGKSSSDIGMLKHRQHELGQRGPDRLEGGCNNHRDIFDTLLLHHNSSAPTSNVGGNIVDDMLNDNITRNDAKTTSNGYKTTPLRMQRHQVTASQLKLVLGARLSWEVANTQACVDSINVPAPPRIGVAGLKGLSALGICGQPAMVIGADIWARSRAVLCLKAGKLFIR